MVLSDLLTQHGYRSRPIAPASFKRLADKSRPHLDGRGHARANGFQLTRASRPVCRVPIIMCTSKNQETDRVWGMRQERP
jgi:twitching motility two-component system response regulator PilH